jgi:type I restriction enzyme S subunit|tara:strand:- start:794 stop:2083 length:1290 start_codon:yes stop_codon:yes gene_type:complete
MSDLGPLGWTLNALGNVVDVRPSNVDKKTNPEDISIRLCNYTNVYYNNSIRNGMRFMSSTAKLREIERFSLEKDDVIITKDSETPDDIAVPAYVAENMENVVCGYHLALLRPIKSILNGHFLSFLLQLPKVRHHFFLSASGVTRYGLTIDAIKNAEIRLPPLPEQQKIATILSSVDDVIEKTRTQIDKLKDLKTGMMQELLTKGIGHTEFKDSPAGRIPVSWSECTLQDIAVVQTGVAKNGKMTGDLIEVPYLRVANVQDGYLDLTEIKMISIEASRLDRFLLRDEDVLVNEGGDFDKLGRGFIWRNQVSPCVHQNHVFVVRTDKAKLLPLFFNYLSGSEYGKKYYLGCAKQTTNLASLNSTQLKAFPILLPSLQEQKEICDVLQSFDEKLQKVVTKLDSLLILKKALMQDLLTGKVRVKVDNPEVAAA